MEERFEKPAPQASRRLVVLALHCAAAACVLLTFSSLFMLSAVCVCVHMCSLLASWVMCVLREVNRDATKL